MVDIGRIADIAVTVATEGDSDLAVVERLLAYIGLQMGPAYVLNGKSALDRNLAGYNNAARFAPWLVVRDLNSDAECAPQLVAAVLPTRALYMCFQVAVRAAEAWLMADGEQLADFLAVPLSRIPREPDRLQHPKRELVNLARRSRRRAVREDMVPEPGISRDVGPGYTGRLIEFAQQHWRPSAALHRSPSLVHCIAALRRWSET